MQSSPHYRWVIVAAGALITCVAFGAILALPVLLSAMSADTGWTRAGISLGVTLNFLVMGIASIGAGYLSDRIGARPVLVLGVALLALGFACASRAPSLTSFQLAYGLIIGSAAACFNAPLMSTVTLWFDRQRALAVALVSAGIGVAPLTMSRLTSWLLDAYGWRDAMLTLGLGSLVVLMPATLLVRRAPDSSTAAATTEHVAGLGQLVHKACRSRAFALLALTSLASCGTHSGPIFHTISYAIGCGLTTATAVTIYGVEGFAGLVGRIVFGVAADRYGVLRAFVAGLLLQACAAGMYALTSQLDMFYAVAFAFGMAYGGVMPLFAALARSYFPAQIMGTMLGILSFASSIGMATGPAVGGWVYDNFHAYTWLYVGSLAVGLCAVVTSLALPRAPEQPDSA